MERRYEGYLAPHGLYILDTYTGEVRFVAHGSEIQTAMSVIADSRVSSNTGTSSAASPNQLSPFENEVISSYPYLIAKPFADLLKEKDSRMKCKLMVDTFTAVLKYLALQLASEYIRAKDVKDHQVHQTLTKDLSRPLISAWNLLIARCLPVLKDNKIPLFSPEIKEAYEKLESKCKEPFLVSHSYSDENGEIKTKTKKLGKIQALINYRNGLAHGFNQSQSRAQKEFDEYYPLLCDILQEVRFISRYTLWHVESSREGVNGIRLMGASPSMKKVDFNRDGVNPSVSPLFLINDATGDILPLYAFFDVDNASETGLPEIGKDIFVFEGNTKNTVIYLSTSGEHLEKSSRFQHWKDLLAQKQLEVEWAETKNLSLDVLCTIGKYISNTGIQALIASDKYLREASIPRQDLNEMLDAFSYGTYNGFVLGGESGIGKSTLLAKKTEEWQADGHMVAFYRGSALNQSDFANKFLRDCALKVHYLEDFLSLVNPIFAQTEKKCYLIIDALNEYAGDLNELIQSVENAIAQASNYPWFKLIVSIRDSAYNRVRSRFGEHASSQYFTVEEEKSGEKIKTNIIRLQPVAKDFVKQLYEAYREYKWKDSTDPDGDGYYKFRPLTTFDELNPDGSTVKQIRSPLMARLIMQSFHRAKLPQQLNNDEAMRLYHDNIVLEKTENSPGFPERKKLLHLLVSELDKQSVERLDRDELMKLPLLRSYLVNAQKDSAYIQLLDLGVLMEEWEAENCYVRFSFDKFLEFLLAEMYWPRINDAGDLISLCKKASGYKILQGAIEIILIRFCLNNQSQQFVQLIDLADQESEFIQSLVKDVSARLLFSLSNEHNTVFENVIAEFPKAPGSMDLLILKELLNKLYLTGNLNGFEKTMLIAVEEAELLNDKMTLSDLMFSQALLDGLKGRIENAFENIEKAIVIKKEINDELGYSNCLKEKGNRLKYIGKIAETEHLYLESLAIKRRIGDKLGISQCLNNLALLYKDQGKIEEAEKLHLESLQIKRELGDKKGISISLNNLGLLYKNQGKIREAEKLYKESFNLRSELGDKQGLSISLNNLGGLYKDQGKMEEAEKLYLNSLKMKQELGDKKGISSSLISLGNLYKDQGKVDEAEKLYKESLKIEQELGDKKGISNSLNNLSILLMNQGTIENVETLLLESLKIDRELNNKKGMGIRLNNLGVLALLSNQDKIACDYFIEAIAIKKELKEKSSLVATFHRAFQLFSAEEQLRFMRELEEMEKNDFTKKEMCWVLNMELINICMYDKNVSSQLIDSLTSRIIEYSKEIKVSDIDDLPVEAFYIAANKLIQLNNFEKASKLSQKSLEWIGQRKTRRRKELEQILHRSTETLM